ncbi:MULTISPECIES: hypothetical protein [unclassified Amycolatopsis]|nr:hypothetical protein [Amycolatopsis sp. Poz14]
MAIAIYAEPSGDVADDPGNVRVSSSAVGWPASTESLVAVL